MRAALLALLMCAVATPAAADRFALTYEGLGMNVVPLGRITVDADVSEDSYAIATTLASGGLMNLFERTNIRAEASGAIDANGAVRWRRYNLDHHYSRKHRVIEMRAGPTGSVLAVITPNYRIWGDPPASNEQKRRSRDPLSTLMAMSIDVGQSRRCTGSYPTFDGRFHYLMELSGGDIDRFRGGGFEGQVLKCRMAYVAVSGYERADRGRRRIPQGQVWFALAEDSRFAPPVRISTPISAGGAVIRLTSWRRAEVSIYDTPPS